MTFLEKVVAKKVEEVKEKKDLRKQDMRAEVIGQLALGILDLYGEFTDDGEEVVSVELKKVKKFPGSKEVRYELQFCAFTENHRIEQSSSSIGKNESVKEDKIVKKLRNIDGMILSSAEIECLRALLKPYCYLAVAENIDGFLIIFKF